DQALGQTAIARLCSAKFVHCPAPFVVHGHALVDKMAWSKHTVYQTKVYGYSGEQRASCL
ncbi:MAG: hypothetical protein ACK4KV_20325, partial [Rhodocyclaceae bacterium]